MVSHHSNKLVREEGVWGVERVRSYHSREIMGGSEGRLGLVVV